MSTFRLSILAQLIAAAYVPAVAYSSMAIGQNTPADYSYATLPATNNRAYINTASFYLQNPSDGFDANGFPCGPFSQKYLESPGNADATYAGVWTLIYTAPDATGIRSVTLRDSATLVSHTFDSPSKTGTLKINYFGNGAVMGIAFNDTSVGGRAIITSLQVFDPFTDLSGGASAVPFWKPQYLRTIKPFDYIRFMDVAQANDDFVNTSAVYATWPTSIPWSMRRTPANVHLNSALGMQGGMPLEWQIDLCTQAGKNGWFVLPELATDDYVTQFATLVAQTMPAGKWSAFEPGNERWNIGNGFWNYRKAGAAGMAEALAAQPANAIAAANIVSFASDGATATVVFAVGHNSHSGLTPSITGLASGYTGFTPTGPQAYVDGVTLTYPCTQPSTGGAVAASTVMQSSGYFSITVSEWSALQYGINVLSFSSDGSTATVKFSQPHGGTTGSTPVIKGLNTGYTGFTPTGNITVVDSLTVTYPCTQAATTSPVAANVALIASGFVALNGASTLFSGSQISSIYDFSKFWHYRRADQMATLIRAAFTAVGRSLNDCKPLLALQAGDQYHFGNKQVNNFLGALKGNSNYLLSSSFTAIAVGGYCSLDQPLNAGFAPLLSEGIVKTSYDGSLVTEAGVNTSLSEVATYAYGASFYSAFVSWCRAQGCEAWGYEVGNDLGPNSVHETSTMRTAKETYQADYVNYGAAQEAIYKAWIQSFQVAGFSKIGWYQCGSGTYAGEGTFNLGQTPNEIDYTTASASQSPKFRAILDSLAGPIPSLRHVFPCVLSGYDCVGNEAVATVASQWPALDGTNLTYNYAGYVGPQSNGQAYYVWCNAATTATCTIVGDYTTSGAITVSVQPLNANGTGGGSFALNASQSGVALGAVSISLQAGANYVFISASANATNVRLHTVAFA